MKFTAIILLSACLAASATGNSQNITIKAKNAPLEKVLLEVKKQSGFHLFYKDEWMKKTNLVDIEVVNKTLEEVLNLCFKNQAYTYEIVDKTIVIKEKPASPKEENPNETFLTTTIDVSGRVTDSDGTPLEGASVKVKGTTNGTTTDASGVFVLKGVDENATLVFSYAEHETVELKVGSRATVTVALKRVEGNLQEVVINKGYYTEKQKLSLANVGHVGAKDIEKQPVTNPLLALQGRVPGLVVTQNTGVPGGGVTVRIQGTNSIANGNDPLIVVDGVPFPSQMLRTTTGGASFGALGILGQSGGTDGGGGNPLNYINPADIEAIDVLKDADATAIYGSRAANGAILITTKKGKPGKMKVNLNLQQGWGKVPQHLDMLNTQEYINMRKEAFKNDGLPVPTYDPSATSDYDLTIWDTTRYTNWQKELIGGTALYSNINVGVSGGTNNLQYRVGGTYNRTTTVFLIDKPTSNASINFNLNTISANKKFRLQLGGYYFFNAINLPLNDLTNQAVTTAPNSPKLYNADGSLNWELNAAGSPTWVNPLALQQAIYESRTTNLVSHSVLSYQILQGLELKSSFGYNQIQTNEFYGLLGSYFAPDATPFLGFLRSAGYTNSRISSWTAEPQLNYHHVLGKSNINLLLAGSFQYRRNAGEQITGTGYSSDQVVRDFRSASSLSLNTLYSEYKTAAVFGHIGYDWSGKYLLNLTLRRDGSSRFGPENRYHNFGAIAVGWIFSQEHCVEKNLPWLSFGKIKGSYGTTGSDQIGDYTFLNLFSSFATSVMPYQNVVGIRGGIFNPYLAWEETKKLQGGLELGFFKDRVMVSSVYAKNRSSNQLLLYDLPRMTGVGGVYTNFPATVENTSLEFSINTINLKKKDFSWETSLNLTIPRNKLVAFPNLEKSTYANRLIVGKPLGTYKEFSYAGVDSVNGLYLVYDKDRKPTSNPNYPADLTTYVASTVKFYGGFENKIQFNGFQLDFLLQFAEQDGSNLVAFFSTPGAFSQGGGNVSAALLGRWQKPGDITDIQRFSTSFLPSTPGNRFVNDIWYLKLRNLSLSYQIPKKVIQKVHIDGCSVYLRGQNLYTLTNFGGFDPETTNIYALPPLRVITVGAQINF